MLFQHSKTVVKHPDRVKACMFCKDLKLKFLMGKRVRPQTFSNNKYHPYDSQKTRRK